MVSSKIYALLATVGKAYPLKAPQGQGYPYMLYGAMADPSDSKDGNELDVITFQVSILAATYAETETLSQAVRTKLDRYTDAASGIQEVRFNGFDDEYIEEENIYHRAVIFKIREIN